MSARDPAGLRGSARDAFANERTAVLPFLPTLFTALLIAGLSFLCRPPSEPVEPAAVAVTALQPGAAGLHDASDAVAPTPSVPATIAFGQLYPLTPDGMRLAASAPRSPAPARVASAAKRGCAAGRCEARRIEPVRGGINPPRPQSEPVVTSAIPSPFRAESDQVEDAMPEDALPFVPTAASAAEAVRTVGGVVSLGGSVLGALVLPR